MNKYIWKNIGSFQMTTTDMVVSDPDYKLGELDSGELHSCVPGEWEAMLGISNEGIFGHIVSLLVVRAKGQAERPLNVLEARGSCSRHFHKMDFEIGVESAKAGFFDKAFYGMDTGIDPDSIENDFSQWGNISLFCQTCYDKTLRREGGVLHCGAVSRSGYGDGIYSGYYHKTKGKIDMAFIEFK